MGQITLFALLRTCLQQNDEAFFQKFPTRIILWCIATFFIYPHESKYCRFQNCGNFAKRQSEKVPFKRQLDLILKLVSK